MIERAYNFACDFCGEARCYLFSNEKDAKHDARIEGWIMHGKHGCFCSQECYLDYKRIENGGEDERRRI